MALVLVLLVAVVFGVAGFIFWLWSLIDALQRPDAEWEQAGQSKLIWILLIIFLGIIGSLIYLLVARPSLEEVKQGF